MSRLRILIPVLAGCLVVAVLGVGGASGGVACKSGNYSGKTKGGHKVSFKVNCGSNTITDLSIKFRANCQTDNHSESGSATYDGTIKIKAQSFKDPDQPGKKEKVYYLGYDKKATTLVANGVSQSGTVLLRGTSPPNGKTEGTVSVSYSYGEDPEDPEGGFLYNCGGVDGKGPAKFTAKRR